MGQESAGFVRTWRYFLVGTLLFCFCGQALGQVDVEHRRLLTLQSGMSVYQSEEALDGYGFFWFNEDHFPWDRTALRLNYAGIYLDGELRETIDTYSADTQAQARVSSIIGLGNGSHSLSLVVTGTHNANSAGAWVWVDAFDVSTLSVTATTRLPRRPGRR